MPAFQKLYVAKKDGQERFILAFTFGEALAAWRAHSAAVAKADPDSLALAVDSLIGASSRPTAAEAEKNGTPEPAVGRERNTEALGLFRQGQRSYAAAEGEPAEPGARFYPTGLTRSPRKGDWFLSGAIPEAYRCNQHNMTGTFQILTPDLSQAIRE